MFTVVAMAGATCAAAVLTLSRVVGFKRIVKHATVTDVTFSIGAIAVIGGTLTGSLVAVMAGLMMALFLSAMKAAYRVAERAKSAWADRPAVPEYLSGKSQAQTASPDPLDVCSAPVVPDITFDQSMAATAGRKRRGPVLFDLSLEGGAA